jgi:hypothetical protein
MHIGQDVIGAFGIDDVHALHFPVPSSIIFFKSASLLL